MNVTRLVNTQQRPVYLDDGQYLRYGNIRPGMAIDVPDTMMNHPQIISAMRLGWLQPATAPSNQMPMIPPVPPTAQVRQGGVVSGPGGSLDAPQYAPGTVSYPGMGGSDAVQLPGFVPRMPEVNEDTNMAPPGISNAASIITGRPVQDINTPQVQPADAMIRQNTPAPVYREPSGPVAADSVMRQAFTPAPVQHNFAVGQPGVMVPGQAGGVTRTGSMPLQPPAYQPPYNPNQPPAYQPPYNPNQPGYQVVRHPGGYGGVQQVLVPPAQPQAPQPGNMGWQVPTTSYPMQREPVDIEKMAEIAPQNLEALTDAINSDSKRRGYIATILTNYRDSDPNKRLYMAMSSVDLEVLYRLLAMEAQGGSGVLAAQIQNRIVALGGQIPDMAQMQRTQADNTATMMPMAPVQTMPLVGPNLMAPPQQAPQAGPSMAVQAVLMQYITQYNDQQKTEFINRIGDLDLLQQLLRAEPSQIIQAVINGRVTAVQAAIAAAEAAAKMPGRPIPAVANAAVVDKPLVPPTPAAQVPQPAPIVQTPVQMPPPNPPQPAAPAPLIPPTPGQVA
jgi:hypothetical protein